MHRFFVGFLTLIRIFSQNLRIFLNQLDRFATGSAGSLGQLAEAHPNWSTLTCFSHFSLIRAQNCAFFFCWIPYSSRNILSKFEIFFQSARSVCNRLSLFFGVARRSPSKSGAVWFVFSHFSLIRAQNYAPFFFFVGFLTFQGISCQNLRIFLNRFTG